MYDYGFMDNTARQAVKRPLRHGGSHFVNSDFTKWLPP